MLLWDHIVPLEDFKILASSNSEFHFKIKESLLIARDKLMNVFWLEYFICTKSQYNNDYFIVSLQLLSIVSYYLLKRENIKI